MMANNRALFWETVKKLRHVTGLGMLRCKEALEKANHNFEDAMEYLHKTGAKIACQKASRAPREGIVRSFVADDHLIMYELNAETDFAVHSDKFMTLQHMLEEAMRTLPATTDLATALETKVHHRTLQEMITGVIAVIGENIQLSFLQIIKCQRNESLGFYNHSDNKTTASCVFTGLMPAEAALPVVMHIAALNPLYVSRDEIAPQLIARERKIIHDLLSKDPNFQKKPPVIRDRIVEGRLNKYLSELCLLEQPLVTDNNIKVHDYLTAKNVTIKGMYRLSLNK